MVKLSSHMMDQISVNSVYLIGFCEGPTLLAIQNERGWDIPGGHIESGESRIEALEREVDEEAGASFAGAQPFGYLRPTEGWQLSAPVMLFYVSQEITLHSFVVSDDCLDRAILPIEAFLKKFHGPTNLMQEILQSAAGYVGKLI